MKPLRSQEQLEEMRRRLYDRGAAIEKTTRHQLSDTKIDVSRDWSKKPVAEKMPASIPVEDGNSTHDSRSAAGTGTEKKKRHYRGFVLSGSVLIFIFVAVISSLFLYFGGNRISSDNIQLSIQGQPLIGGGEVMSMQVAVTNQNTVPIESATLILRYPAGARSVGDSPRNLFEERITLNDIAPGEVQNIPVKVAIFGEENAEKKVEATVEYRVGGSNGMFYKDAEPLVFKISSSPLVLRIDNIEKVASGQLVDVTVTAVSNASSPLEDILITASYPNGFSFENSEPAPVYGKNVWKIDELLPEGSATVKLRGIVNGLTEETLRINFKAGPTNPDNEYLVGAALADARADFTIERPFIDVQVSIDGDTDHTAVLTEGKDASVVVTITNTLDEAVYDMVVEVVPGGNALQEDSITSANGFYDSNAGTVRWETSNNSNFDRVLPGDIRSLNFTVHPGPEHTTASFDLVTNVYARRVAESSAQETLIGTVRAEAKYSSTVSLGSQVGRNVAGFVDRGSIPPQVGEVTSYTVTLVAEAGANDVVDAVVETSLPLYVDWLDLYDTEGTLIYNTVSKKIKWDVGQIAARDRKELSFQVELKPSVSQIDTTPVLLNSQTIRANDRFTGALLQDKAPAVTTELSAEMGYGDKSGEVVK